MLYLSSDIFSGHCSTLLITLILMLVFTSNVSEIKYLQSFDVIGLLESGEVDEPCVLSSASVSVGWPTLSS